MGLFKNLFQSEKDGQQFGKKPTGSGRSKPTYFGNIYPYFKQVTQPNSNTDQPNAILNIELVIRPIVADLNCFYGIDSDNGIQIIQESMLEDMNLTADELHELAMNNFDRFVGEKLQVHGNADGAMYVLDGNFEAGLMLMDDIWDQVEEQVGGPVVVFVPSRDVVFSILESNQEKIKEFIPRAREVFETGDHPLSQYIYIRKGKDWEIYQSILD